MRLTRLGLPQVGNVQGGFSPLLEVYGKGVNRFPILVQFQYPLNWVVTLPSNDQNGEDGTVQAGDYAKGDTATFYVYDEPGNVKVRTVLYPLIHTVASFVWSDVPLFSNRIFLLPTALVVMLRCWYNHLLPSGDDTTIQQCTTMNHLPTLRYRL